MWALTFWAAICAIISISLLNALPQEYCKLDMTIDKGKIVTYRAKVKVSFKYEGKWPPYAITSSRKAWAQFAESPMAMLCRRGQRT